MATAKIVPTAGRTPAASATPIETAKAVFGESPKDVLFLIETAKDTLSWLGAVLHAIEVLHERGGGEIHIKHLADMGQYVADDIGNTIDCEHEKMAAAVEAAISKGEVAA